ncbi:hypothetical protein [Undibacterium sp.]|uniref:hypothetical protein n=1 Tax=Undibacterium sp. TaxID=1914977 RepID=UPI002D19B88F|nr:hypothetical protein [Undibacterium sp.]HTD06175.1 hypothetical protein [Undibacterium sp.]
MRQNPASIGKKILAACLLASCLAAHAQANDCGSCQASALSTFVVVGGSMSAVVASGAVVVDSVEKVADGIIVVFKGASDAGKASLKFTGTVAGGLSLAAGTVVETAAMSTGTMLMVSGQALAFIPNQVGASLLHQSRV